MYEAFFFLKYYSGFSFTEAYNLPVKIRNWFIQRLGKQLEKENEEMKKAQGSSKM